MKKGRAAGAPFFDSATLVRPLISTPCRRFLLWLICLLPAAWAGAVAAVPCPADRIDERAVLKWVHDGDTLVLADGRKVRLIGINTPELARDDRPAEPLAVAARDALRDELRKRLGKGATLALRYGRDRRDRYGRLLAHVYAGGENITAWLLRQGYGFVVAVPPNLWQHACYRRNEARARSARRGVWSLDYFRPRPAARLSARDRGFRIITGRVLRTGESRRSLWLNLEGGVALRIARRDLDYFGDFDLGAHAGRRVEARGWLHPRRGRLVMQIRHPFALRLLSSDEGEE